MSRKWLMLPIGLLAVVVVGYIGGELVRLLWNWLMPALFGLREVTFWQALGLLALCRILFGGRGGGSRSGPSMSPEQRERFRRRMRERFGFEPGSEQARDVQL